MLTQDFEGFDSSNVIDLRVSKNEPHQYQFFMSFQEKISAY